jgi:hypothetical protein
MYGLIFQHLKYQTDFNNTDIKPFKDTKTVLSNFLTSIVAIWRTLEFVRELKTVTSANLEQEAALAPRWAVVPETKKPKNVY